MSTPQNMFWDHFTKNGTIFWDHFLSTPHFTRRLYGVWWFASWALAAMAQYTTSPPLGGDTRNPAVVVFVCLLLFFLSRLCLFVCLFVCLLAWLFVRLFSVFFRGLVSFFVLFEARLRLEAKRRPTMPNVQAAMAQMRGKVKDSEQLQSQRPDRSSRRAELSAELSASGRPGEDLPFLTKPRG